LGNFGFHLKNQESGPSLRTDFRPTESQNIKNLMNQVEYKMATGG